MKELIFRKLIAMVLAAALPLASLTNTFYGENKNAAYSEVYESGEAYEPELDIEYFSENSENQAEPAEAENLEKTDVENPEKSEEEITEAGEKEIQEEAEESSETEITEAETSETEITEAETFEEEISEAETSEEEILTEEFSEEEENVFASDATASDTYHFYLAEKDKIYQIKRESSGGADYPVSSILKGHGLKGTYLDNSHAFYGLFDNGTRVSNAYCTQIMKSGPKSELEKYIIGWSYGTKGLYTATGEEFVRTLMACLNMAFAEMGRYAVDGSFGEYYIDGKLQTGLLIQGAFFPMTKNEARAITQAAIHFLCKNKNVNDCGTQTLEYSLTAKDPVGEAYKALLSIGLKAFDIKVYTGRNKSGNAVSYSPTVNVNVDMEEIGDKIKYTARYEAYYVNPNVKAISSFETSISGARVAYEGAYTALKINCDSLPEGSTVWFSNITNEYLSDTGYFTGANTIGEDRGIVRWTQTAEVVIPKFCKDKVVLSFVTASATKMDTTVKFMSAYGNGTLPQAGSAAAKLRDGTLKDASLQLMVATGNKKSISDSKSIEYESVKTSFSLKKKAESGGINISDNPNYSLENAVYSVYEDYDEETGMLRSEIAEFTTDSEGTGHVTKNLYSPEDVTTGNTRLTGLPEGTYYVKETIAPRGFSRNDEVVSLVLSQLNPYEEVIVYDIAHGDPTVVKLEKTSSESVAKEDEDKSVLQGAEFVLKYYPLNTNYDYTEEDLAKLAPRYTYKLITDENGMIDFSEDSYYENKEGLMYEAGSVSFPYGVISIEEVKAPSGFTLNGEYYDKNGWRATAKDGKAPVYIFKLIENDSSMGTLYAGNMPIDNSVISLSETTDRKDLRLFKYDESTKEGIEGVEFTLFMLDKDGKIIMSRDICTDENGVFDSRSQGEDFWFSLGYGFEPGRGRLLSGYSYKLVEKKTDRYYEIEPLIIDVTNESEELIQENIGNKRIPEIGTVASVTDDKTVYRGRDEDIQIVDNVKYSYMDEGTRVKIEGRLMNKETGEQLFDDKGNELVSKKDVEIADENGNIYVEFDINSSYIFTDIIIYEYIFDENGELICKHEDIESREQTIKSYVEDKTTETTTEETTETTEMTTEETTETTETTTEETTETTTEETTETTEITTEETTDTTETTEKTTDTTETTSETTTEKTKDKLVRTGDDTQIPFAAGAMAVAGVAITLLAFLRRRDNGAR